MSALTLDIETIPDPEMPAYVPREGGDAFPPPPHWQIVCIGLLRADNALRTEKIGVLEGSEAAMLRALVRCVEGPERRPDLVTFNGRRFDLPVITARCMRHGVPFPARFDREVVYRYSDAGHFDVADALTDHGAGRHASLDAWAKCIGMPGKLDCNGADVEVMVKDGRLADVQAYCMADVAQTHAVRLRFDLTRGRLDRAAYLAAMGSLIDAIDAHPKLVTLAAAMNRNRLMLEG